MKTAVLLKKRTWHRESEYIGLLQSHGIVTSKHRILSLTDSLAIDELHLFPKFLLVGI